MKIDYGSFNDEFPEQMMVLKYLKGHEKVLEIGGNIGRNSLIIAYILNKYNNNNFVSLECDKDICNQFIHNKTINNLDFFVENSALSMRNLIQKGWDTIVSDEILDGYTKVNTISFEELNKKYNIIFDTLVLDCEGAFYYILMDTPEILNNINLIIMENDYWEIDKKNYIDNILKNNDFYIDYTESGGWGPCFNNFFEVWKKSGIPDKENEIYNLNIQYYRISNNFLHFTDDEIIHHWVNYGQFENRSYKLPDGFNIEYYRISNNFLDFTDNEIIHHWVNHGQFENRSYKLPDGFNIEYYRTINNFLDFTDDEIIQHWVNHGQYENRSYKKN